MSTRTARTLPLAILPVLVVLYVFVVLHTNNESTNFLARFLCFVLGSNALYIFGRFLYFYIFRSLSGFFVGFYIVLGFSFLSASFCIFLVRERVDRSALLQALAGVEPFCFWLSTFFWDIINFFIPCVLIIVSLKLFSIFCVNDFYILVVCLRMVLRNALERSTAAL